jgi:uncharacterized membrane protein YjfL (UPF0719 family)
MRTIIVTSAAAAALFAAGTLFGSMHRTSQSDSDLNSLFDMSAAAQAGGVYVNAVDLVVIPSEMSKFVEAIKENASNSVKEPGLLRIAKPLISKNSSPRPVTWSPIAMCVGCR